MFRLFAQLSLCAVGCKGRLADTAGRGCTVYGGMGQRAACFIKSSRRMRPLDALTPKTRARCEVEAGLRGTAVQYTRVLCRQVLTKWGVPSSWHLSPQCFPCSSSCVSRLCKYTGRSVSNTPEVEV